MKTMKISKIALAVVGMTAATSAFAITGDARGSAMGGVGVASANYLESSIYNPAMGTKVKESDDFGVMLSVGALAADPDNMEESVDDVSTMVDDFDDFGITPTNDDWNQTLDNLDESVLRGEVSSSLLIAIPTKAVSTTFFTNVNAKVIGTTLVDDADRDYFVNGGVDDLKSETHALVGGTVDIGFAFAKEFTVFDDQALSVGVAPKYQKVYAYYAAETVEDFEDVEFDENDAETSGAFNIDLGVSYTPVENVTLAVAATNLIEQELETNVSGLGGTATYKVAPMVVVGAAYSNDFFTIATDVDLTENEYFEIANIKATEQYARVGVEFDAWEWAQLRAGYAHSMSDFSEDKVTAGIGIKAFGSVGIDVAAEMTEEREVGAVVNLVAKF
ncbi:conjugal transfer protein TraF [Vibrio crassostreae]|uniref:conjugal transfer protein TraF n=1 Tax=Vibrio crassostreae TaxID=246167 RepID=UPI001B311482|nr:conjugal transfer protein TraF [Vibrio crassostreae]